MFYHEVTCRKRDGGSTKPCQGDINEVFLHRADTGGRLSILTLAHERRNPAQLSSSKRFLLLDELALLETTMTIDRKVPVGTAVMAVEVDVEFPALFIAFLDTMTSD